MKKVQIISKDGNKVEVYYLSDHPLNKMVASENVVIKEVPYLDQTACSVSPIGVVGPTGLDNPTTEHAIYDYDYEKPLAGSGKKHFPFDSKKHISDLLFAMKPPAPSTFALDDSLESDAVKQEDLKANDLYRIKGLNVIAKFVQRQLGATPSSIQLFEFNFHGYRFWVDSTMILKHRFDG